MGRNEQLDFNRVLQPAQNCANRHHHQQKHQIIAAIIGSASVTPHFSSPRLHPSTANRQPRALTHWRRHPAHLAAMRWRQQQQKQPQRRQQQQHLDASHRCLYPEARLQDFRFSVIEMPGRVHLLCVFTMVVRVDA